MQEVNRTRSWARVAAIWIDTLIICGFTYVIVIVARLFAIYILFELTAVVVALLYSILFISWKGQTFGKSICRSAVASQGNQSKWRSWVALGLAFGISAFLVTSKVVEYVSDYMTYREMMHYSQAPTPYDKRDSSLLKEVSSLKANEDSVFVHWLNEHGKNPVEYAVEVASRHQVTIFGEEHFIRGQVLFLNKIIPALYHQAGVRYLAMEACSREDNEDIDRLITAPNYDRELALRIGRHHGWPTWGWKEYWDVFETVWQLNRSISDERQKMRIVGIDRPFDGTSFSLALGGDDAVKGPFWEKLRIMRALIGLPEMIFRDELMAKEVEGIIEKGRHGIVWIGSAHSFIHYKQPYRDRGRMAYTLHQKYGDKIFQVTLHGNDLSPDLSPILKTPEYSGPGPMMGNFLERIMAARRHIPAGFDVADSPFALLRDSTNYFYHFQPSVGWGDVTSGYIYLEPREAFQQCQWAEGFVTAEMFAKYKPFYEGKADTTFRDAEEVNTYFSRASMKK